MTSFITNYYRTGRFLNSKRRKLRFYIFLILSIIFPFSLFSQEIPTENTSVDYRLETRGSVAYQSITPFWIHNNSEGIIPLDANFALLLANASGTHRLNKNTWIEAGLSIVGETTGIADSIGTSRAGAFLQQWYAAIAYRALKLSVGARPINHSILDRSLSSGDLVFSPNARPFPEINLSIPEFVTVPFTKNYLQFKGDFALGKFMDDAYTRDVKAPNAAYAQNILIHHKSVFFSIREPSGKIPLQLIFGVEHSVQYGGSKSNTGPLPQSFSDFLRVVVGSGGGEDAPFGEQVNRLGNHLGTYSLRLGYTFPFAEFAVYKQHYFEDNSGMEYANWRDGIWGFEWTFFKQTYLKKFVFEYIQTMNQSGPFLFPEFHKVFPEGMKARIGGGDNYYNHGIYSSGWSYFGHAIGNPLVTSPEYNQDGTLGFKDNRIKAWHGGFQGNILPELSYRILGTASYGYGTMGKPFLERKYGLSGLLECNYSFPNGKGWEVGIQLGADKGTLYENNIGGLLRIAKTGTIIK